MAFERLPTEILYMIARESIPESYESLTLTSKSVHAACRPLLEEHKLVRNFREFSYHKRVLSTHGWPIRTPVQLLYEIAKNPDVARIIEFADLRNSIICDDDWTDVDSEMDSQWMASDHAIAITKLFEESPIAQSVISAEGSQENQLDWLKDILENQERWNTEELAHIENTSDLANLFVLTLLPNVRRLAMGSGFLDLNEGRTPGLLLMMAKVFGHLAESARNGGALSQLKELVPTCGTGYDARLSLSSFRWLLSLPLVEICTQFSCIALDDGYTGLVWIPRLQDEQFPALRELTLLDSVIGAEEVEDITSRMPLLESLEIEFGTKWHGCGFSIMYFDRFIESLGRGAGDHLRSLSLTRTDSMNQWETSLQSFRCLQALLELEVDCSLFLGGEEDNKDDEIPQLVHELPPSLQRLRLILPSSINVREHQDVVLGLFDEFGKEYATALPELELIEVVRSGAELRKWTTLLKHALENVPILQVLAEPSFEMQSSSEPLPAWFELEHY